MAAGNVNDKFNAPKRLQDCMANALRGVEMTHE